MRIHYSRIPQCLVSIFIVGILTMFCLSEANAQRLSLLGDFRILPPIDGEEIENDLPNSQRRFGYWNFLTFNEIRSKPAAPLAKPKTISKHTLKSGDACSEWARMYEFLTDDARKTLEKEWVVISSSDDHLYNQAYYVLSDELVKDCDLRVKIGLYLGRILISAHYSRADKAFGRQHSVEIVKVLRHIWDSPAFSNDGIHTEKYTVLDFNGGLRPEVVIPFIGELIRKREGLNWYLTCLALERPSPVLKPVLLEQLNAAEAKQDLPQQVYILIALQQISPSPTLLSKLGKINHSDSISNEDVSRLTQIISTLRLGKKINTEDIDNLDITVPET